LLKASKVIEDDLDERKKDLLASSHQLAAQKNLGSTIWYLAQYARSNVDRETLFNTYQQLAKDTYRIGRAGKISRIAIYDSVGHLVTFAMLGSNGGRVGFVERFPVPAFLVAALKEGEELNSKALRKVASLEKMGFEFGAPLPQQESVHYAVVDGLLAIEIHVPIMGETFDPATGKQKMMQLGLIAMAQTLDQAFVEHLSRLTDIKINVFTPQGFCSGSMIAYRNPDWASTRTVPDARAITLNEIVVEGASYYQSLIPLYNDNKAAGTIAALYSKEIVQKSTWEMIRILGLIAVASLLLIFPFAWYFATSISHPLTVLSHIFRGVASGKKRVR
jgi:hypothetical protein